MGRDKASVAVQGRTLLETALAAARSVAQEVWIAGSPQLYGAQAPAIPDIYTGCGPLGGIHAALTHTRTEFNLVLAVDTPFVSHALLAFLAQRALSSGAVATAPVINDYPQPLCAVYSREFLPIAGRALEAGHYKIVPLFARTTTLLIPQSELAQFAFTAEMFDNLNTPEDVQRAIRRELGKDCDGQST